MNSSDRTTDSFDPSAPVDPLKGLRILDLSTTVAGQFGTRLLAGWGADVIKVEPPGGDPVRSEPPFAADGIEGSIQFAYVNSGKRSVVIDANSEDGKRNLEALLAGADAVVESSQPGQSDPWGIDIASVRAAHPSLVICSVTPFGKTGPRSGWRMTALTDAAAGGQMVLCGDDGEPPLKTAGNQAAAQAGLHVFASTLTALFAAKRTGHGDHIDLSIQEVQAACLEGFGPTAMVRGFDSTRSGNQLRAVWGIYPCADGHVGVAAMQRQTPSVWELIGMPELIDQPEFKNLLLNPDVNPIAEAYIGAWTAERTAAEIFEEAGKKRAPFSMIATPRELLGAKSLWDGGLWQEVSHPVLGRHVLPTMPLLLNGSRGRLTPAPTLGEHTEGVLSELTPQSSAAPTGTPALPMTGVRVIDLSQVWAGPYAARFLADMGADVIHVEGPAFPDAVRTAARADEPRAFNKSPYFNEYNRNKRGVALDLHSPDGIEALKRLVKTADVVLENWSVGVSERLGIGYDDLKAINPDIVFVQMPAYGKTGPDAHRVGFGPAIEQMGGLVALQGYEGGPPHKSGISYGDPNAGIVAAGAMALGLLKRERTGEGSHIVILQRDNVTGMVGEFMVAESLGVSVPTRMGNKDVRFAPHNAYRCRDDSGRWQGDARGNPIAELTDTWMAIAVDSDDAWLALKGVIDDSRLDEQRFGTMAGRLAHQDEIDAVVGEWARGQDATVASTSLQAAGVCAAPVLTPLMLVRDAHLAERGFFSHYDHPEAGTCTSSAPVWRLANSPYTGMRPAPCFGEHNRAVLRDLGGYSDTEIDAFEARKILVSEPVAG